MNKDTSLNEIVEAISLEQGKKYISTIKLNSPQKVPLFLHIQEQKKVDYAKLFSYFNKGVKKSPYISYVAEKQINKMLNNKKKKEPINYCQVVDFVKTSKIDRLLGKNNDFINPHLKEKFDNFKIFNQNYIRLLYQIVGI